jgi:UDP-N-acetylmuramate--alanine ligase
MIDVKNIRKIYFLGIGGIGMSSLARYFKFHGKEVSGYDRTETALTGQLQAEGIPVHFTDDPEWSPKDAGLIVYTPALSKDHRELNFYLNNNYPVLKRSDVLGLITNSSFNICVAGTHGKTTVTTMIAHLLRDSGYGCNAFLGGISVNYNSNFWSNERNVCVVEADEYDRSFLKLSPDIAVITAMDPDHLDIYGTPEAVESAFIEFSGKLKPGGWLLSKYGLKREAALKAADHQTYGANDERADFVAKNIRIINGSYLFDVVSRNWKLEDIGLQMGGLHNVENITAAIVVAHRLDIGDEKIKKAVLSFKGVRRRFEYIIPPPSGKGLKNDMVFIDDYAHHPEELKALINGARGIFPDRKCTIVFQPHLFTRTRDFADGFAESLDLADEIILLPIYPARELPIEGVTSRLIRDKMKNRFSSTRTKEETLEWIRNNKNDLNKKGLLITAGAGDIDAMVGSIKKILE